MSRKTANVKNEEYAKNVLLVSENRADVQKIEHLLATDESGLRYKLYRCTLLCAALEQLGNRKLDIDVIILDLRLPASENPDNLYGILKNASPEAPIIILTGDTQDERTLALPALAAGAAGHIHGMSINSLTELISSMLPQQKREWRFL